MSKTYYNPNKIIKIVVQKERDSGIKFYKGLSVFFGYIFLIRPGFYKDGYRYYKPNEEIPNHLFVKECEGVKYLFNKSQVRVFYEGSHYQIYYFDTFQEAVNKAEEIRMISGIKIWLED